MISKILTENTCQQNVTSFHLICFICAFLVYATLNINEPEHHILLSESYFVHVNRELCKPLPGIFLLNHTGHMQTGCVQRTRTSDHIASDKTHFKSVTMLHSSNEKCKGTDLTQGDHEGGVEQTQIGPVRVIHYSPGTDTVQHSEFM